MKLKDITDFETLEDLLIYSDLPTERQICTLIQAFNQFSSIPVKRVLDIGCGYGRHSRALAKQGFRVTGIDISKKAIEIAESKSSDCVYFVDDIRTFKSDFNFDSAYAHNSTMAYFIDDNEFKLALSNIYSLIKTGGLFVFDYFYPTNMLEQNKYERNLHQTKRVNGLTLDKYSQHNIDVKNQIHEEKSKYVVTGGIDIRTFLTTEILRYYEPEQIKDILKNVGFSEIILFDRDTYTPITDTTIGIYVISKK